LAQAHVDGFPVTRSSADITCTRHATWSSIEILAFVLPIDGVLAPPEYFVLMEDMAFFAKYARWG
jgi:hypothetical protein